MTLAFVKYFVIYVCSFYVSNKIHGTSTFPVHTMILSMLISVSYLLINIISPGQLCFLPICLFIYINMVVYKNAIYACKNSVISYALVFCIYTLSVCIITSILSFVRFNLPLNPVSLVTCLACLLTPILTISLFSIKRFKSGMPFLHNRFFSIIGVVLSLFIIILSLFIRLTPKSFSLLSFLIQLLACLLLIPFIVWWRSQLTKSYRQYLKDAETRELRAKVAQLSEDNQRQSQIVHKDNKLITAMTSSVLNFVEQSPDYSPEHLAAYSQSLHKELLSLSSHRQDSLSRLSGTVTGQFHTGYMMLDSVLNLQAKQAKDCAIAFSVAYNADFFTKVFSFIDEEQLTHIVADLVQNAIIATKEMSNKSVDISFVLSPHAPSIQISDSGESFPIVVLNNLGQQRCSQHLHDGGSGIGLMDIWTLKNTAKATLLIEEFPDGAKFTKRIHLIFDKKNRYLIISDRKEELSAKLHRPDVLLLSSGH